MLQEVEGPARGRQPHALPSGSGWLVSYSVLPSFDKHVR